MNVMSKALRRRLIGGQLDDRADYDSKQEVFRKNVLLSAEMLVSYA